MTLTVVKPVNHMFSTFRSLFLHFFLVLTSLFHFTNAQVQTVGMFPHSTFSTLKVTQKIRYVLPPIDNARIIAHELARNSHGLKPYKFAQAVNFKLDIGKDGEWSIDASGTAKVWRAIVTSVGAESISVLFDDFYLPPNSEFYVVGQNMTLGAFTGRLNNKDDHSFSTTPIAGDTIILEYWEALEDLPQDEDHLHNMKVESDKARITVEAVVHGFRKSPLELRDSGACNIDVACPLGNKYRDLINSIGIFITDQGQRFCTGAVLNNPRQDGRQLFLTANHCIFQNTSRFIVGFNYQFKNCVSGGAPFPDEPPMQTVQGMRLLATWESSDFALLEILENIPDSYNVYYAGWTRENVAPSNVVGLHHPSGDVKKISTYTGVTTPSYWQEAPKTYHWKVPSWTHGITEPGSSGSPLFNSKGRVVGHLHGGESSCENPTGFDLYGALVYDWETGPLPKNHLKQFLDPDNKRVRGMGGNYYTSSKKGPSKAAIKRFVGHDHHVNDQEVKEGPNDLNAITKTDLEIDNVQAIYNALEDAGQIAQKVAIDHVNNVGESV